MMKISFCRWYSPKFHRHPPPPHGKKRRKQLMMDSRVQYEATNEQKCSKYIPQNCKNCITHILIIFLFSLKWSWSPVVTSGHFLRYPSRESSIRYIVQQTAPSMVIFENSACEGAALADIQCAGCLALCTKYKHSSHGGCFSLYTCVSILCTKNKHSSHSGCFSLYNCVCIKNRLWLHCTHLHCAAMLSYLWYTATQHMSNKTKFSKELSRAIRNYSNYV